MLFNPGTLELFLVGIQETFYMVFVSSLVSYLFGIPLGIFLVVSDPDGILPMPVLQKILGILINLLRSVPFLILLIMVIPLTRLIVGTSLGAKAVVVPLVISAAPYVARIVESSIREVDAGVVEAAKSMGASPLQIIMKVYLPEARPSLLVGAAISVTTILGYSAMSGAVGGGGLGDIAIKYGYNRYQTDMMLVSVAILVIIVQVIQEFGMWLSRSGDKRIR